jgi:hypothetical protein
MEQLTLLMEELKNTKEEFNKTLAMQKVVEEKLFSARQPLPIQPTVQIQPQPQPQPQSEYHPLSLSQPELHSNTNQETPPLPQQYVRTAPQQFRPYPDQEIINTYQSDKLNFDSPHQNQETLIDADFFNDNTNGSMDLVKDDDKTSIPAFWLPPLSWRKWTLVWLEKLTLTKPRCPRRLTCSTRAKTKIIFFILNPLLSSNPLLNMTNLTIMSTKVTNILINIRCQNGGIHLTNPILVVQLVQIVLVSNTRQIYSALYFNKIQKGRFTSFCDSIF